MMSEWNDKSFMNINKVFYFYVYELCRYVS